MGAAVIPTLLKGRGGGILTCDKAATGEGDESVMEHGGVMGDLGWGKVGWSA